MKEQHGNNDTNEEDKRQAASGSQSEREHEQQPAHDGSAPGSERKGAADGGWEGVNDGIDRAEADVSHMMDDLEYIRAKVRVLRGRYG